MNLTGTRSQGWLWLVALLLAIFAMRVHTIDATHMRDDEEIAFRTTENRPVGYTIWYNTQQDVHAPTWFVSFWAWQQFVGSGEFTARVYSILLTMFTLAVIYRLGRRWFGTAEAGMFAVAAFGVNAYALIYSLEIRPYALVMLVAALSMWAYTCWLAKPTWRRALLWGASAALLLWIHYYLAFLVIVQAVFTLLRRPSRRVLIQAVGAGGFALLLWLPLLPVFVGQVLHLAEEEVKSGDFRGLGIGSTTELTSLPAILDLATIISNGAIVLYALVLLTGIVMLRRNRHYWLALAWAFGVPVVNLLINLVASVYTQRYVTYLSVGLALALGAALAALPRRYGARWLALIGFCAVSLWLLPAQMPVRTPYRDIFQTMSRLSQPDDVVYMLKAGEEGHWIRWQVTHYLTPALNANLLDDMTAARDARRVWFVTGDWFADDVQAAFRSLEATHPLQRVLGDCNREWCFLAQLLEAPPHTEPILFGADMAFWGHDITRVSESAVDLRLWWRVETPPREDYSIGVQLLDAGGSLVAQTDGPINHYASEIFQTSRLEAGKIYIDHRTLSLPSDLPPGDYTLILIVYQPWDGVRLSVADGADHLLLQSLTIPS
jgi:hypothetical protein